MKSLDQIVDEFETAWNAGPPPRLGSFFLPVDHAEFEETALELLCVDLERRFQSGSAKAISEYRYEFPELLGRSRVLERLAFEEYRLRCSLSQPVDPEEYRVQFGVNVDHWPRLATRSEAIESAARTAIHGGVADEMDRITSVTRSLPRVGERFFNFDIIEKLGECRFGRVYLARQSDLADRRVVVKVTTNLWAESDRLARLQHTNIVPIYSVHQEDGLQAVCMPYLGRHTFRRLLRLRREASTLSGRAMVQRWMASSPLCDGSVHHSPHRQLNDLSSLSFELFCAWLMSRVAAGLSHAHERNILHRDLKPANVLLTDELQPLVLDFNLSEEVVSGGRAVLIGGTLQYMAPEHLLAVVAGGHVDHRSDIYSLGVMLFELLTGELPFPVQDGSTIGSLSYQLHARRESRLSVNAPDVSLSADMKAITLRCLAASPHDRYQTASDLHEDLERHLSSLPLKHAVNPSRWQRGKKWIRRHPRASASSAVGTVLGTAVIMLSAFLASNERTLARHSALTEFRRFEDLSERAMPPLSGVISDPETIELGMRMANQALDIYSVSQPDWSAQSRFVKLDRSLQHQLTESLVHLQYLMASALMERASRTSDAGARQTRLHRALHRNEWARRVAVRADLNTYALLQQHAHIKEALGHANPAQAILGHGGARPDSAASRWMNAIAHLRAKDYDEASVILGQLALDLPRNYFIWFVQGNCEYGLNHFEEAASRFTACIALNPEYSYAYFHRGICRLRMKRYGAAERDFTEAIHRRPSHANAFVNRALARLELKKFYEAIDDLDQSVALGNDEALAYLARSRAWKALGRFEDAQRDMQKGLDTQPKSVEGWIQRGLVRLRSDPAAALADLDHALALEPNSRKALQNKSSILSQLGRADEAIETLSRLIESHPSSSVGYLSRGLLRARLGWRDEAVEDGETGLRMSDTPDSHYQMARLLAQTSKTQPVDSIRGEMHLQIAFKRQPSLVQLIDRDPDLAPILGQPEVQGLILAARALIDEAQ